LILLEDGSHNVDYQGKQYCFLLAAVDNDRTNKGENMKSNRTERCVTTKPFTGKKPRPLSTTAEHKRQHQQDQGFIKAMNELTAKAGLLSDDPYFGGL
jgi:antitoxin CcdA